LSGDVSASDQRDGFRLAVPFEIGVGSARVTDPLGATCSRRKQTREEQKEERGERERSEQKSDKEERESRTIANKVGSVVDLQSEFAGFRLGVALKLQGKDGGARLHFLTGQDGLAALNVSENDGGRNQLKKESNEKFRDGEWKNRRIGGEKAATVSRAF
jgi:hypothetical protein